MKNLRSGLNRLNGWQRLGIVVYVPWIIANVIHHWDYFSSYKSENEWLGSLEGPMHMASLDDVRKSVGHVHYSLLSIVEGDMTQASPPQIFSTVDELKFNDDQLFVEYTHKLLFRPGQEKPPIEIELIQPISQASLQLTFSNLKDQGYWPTKEAYTLAAEVDADIYLSTQRFERDVKRQRELRNVIFNDRLWQLIEMTLGPVIIGIFLFLFSRWIYRGFRPQ